MPSEWRAPPHLARARHHRHRVQDLGLRLAPGRSAPGDDEVKGAYRRLVLELHPDRQSGKGAAAQKKAAERFTAVLAAYEVLRDPALRARYDAGELVEASVEL